MGCQNCKKISKPTSEITLEDIDTVIKIQKIFRKFSLRKKIKAKINEKIKAHISLNNKITQISINNFQCISEKWKTQHILTRPNSYKRTQ